MLKTLNNLRKGWSGKRWWPWKHKNWQCWTQVCHFLLLNKPEVCILYLCHNLSCQWHACICSTQIPFLYFHISEIISKGSFLVFSTKVYYLFSPFPGLVAVSSLNPETELAPLPAAKHIWSSFEKITQIYISSFIAKVRSKYEFLRFVIAVWLVVTYMNRFSFWPLSDSAMSIFYQFPAECHYIIIYCV